MTAQTYITRKGISVLLIITLFITGFSISPINSFAATKTVIENITVNDLAYYDIWKHVDGTWQKGIKQGSSVSATFTISISGAIPSNATVTSCTGEFDKNFNDFNYYDFTVPDGYISNGPIYSADKTVTYAVNTTLISNTGDNGLNIKNDSQSDMVEGYRYYIPVTFDITYQYEVEIGDFEPDLSLPSSAKQGENYTASDATVVDSDDTIDHAVLEKHYGDGNWETVTTWNGTGKSGENTGGSINESYDEICTIAYRLTVYDIYDQVKSVTKTINITDNREVNGQATLELPEHTYEGHPALAEDVSTFEVDGVNYSAQRAYAENVADNSFDPSGSYGSVSRLTSTKADVTFSKRGNYTVTLYVDLAGGSTLSDTKPINVRKTPYIIDNLGGFQKENRKQVLSMSVATYPGKPIIDYYVELMDLKTGQTITLTPSRPQQNNATIKTRTITKGGDNYWTNYELQFLTKNTVSQEYRYTIYMKDSKGDTDTVQKTFTVAPDLPPNAQISIPESFIRNKGTNIAEIQAEDSSTTDGDQLQRIWTVKGVKVESLSGFKDNSFGSRQKVQYNKTGVGKEIINLNVKDIWIEPTLEEYITEDDYKSSSVSAITDVINIAPTVRLEPKDTYEADVAIVTTKASQSAIEASINDIKAALIEADIDVNLQIIPTATPNNEGYRRTAYVEWPVSINCSTCQSTGLLFDSEYTYRVVSVARTVSGYQEVCTNPHTIYAMDSDGNTAWSYTVNEFASFRIALDQQEKYLYVISSTDNKTILLNRNNGAYITTLNVAFSSGTYILKDNLIYILTGNNIQRYDSDTGTLMVAATVGGSLGRLQDGKIKFVAQENPYKFNIVSFDLVNETLTYQSIPQLEEYLWTTGGSGVYPTDMDTTGKVTFTQTLRYDNDNVGVCLWLGDARNGRTYNLGRVASPNDARANSVGFVKDETGKAMYMYHGLGDDDSTTKTTRHYYYINIYDLGNGDTPPQAHSIYGKKYNSVNYCGSISYAQYHSDQNAIYLMMGTAWQGYDWGGNMYGVMCKIQLPNWSLDFNQYGWGWDVADEYGAYNDSLSATYYSHDVWTGMTNRVKLYKHSLTEEQATAYTLNKYANFRDDVVHVIETGYTTAQELVDKVICAFKNIELLKVSYTGSGIPASMTRTFNLTAGKTYYYEYELKDAKNTTGSAFEAIAPDIVYDKEYAYTGTADLGVLTAKKIVYEDFNDSTLDPFFTYYDGSINGGLTSPGTAKGSKNRVISTSANIKFNIPVGQKAIVIFDVRGVNYDETGFKSGAYVNGQRYDKTPRSGFDISNYTHPYLLKEGENTITAYSIWYGRGTDGNYISIDNLRIVYLDDSTGSGGVNCTVTEKDGWKQVDGTFTIPVGSYKAQPVEHYSNWPPNSVNSGLDYSFTIPEGYAAKIFPTFQGYAARSGNTAGYLSTVNQSFVHIGRENYITNVGMVSNDERFYVGEFEGANTFAGSSNYQRSTWFSAIEAYVYPNNLKGATNFFFDGDKVYSPAETFSGKVSVQIRFPAGTESFMKNLKVYYIKDGKKIYMENQVLDNSDGLSNWAIDSKLNVSMATLPVEEEEEDVPLVYKKGQLVSYNIFYDDYENDPSKKKYWRYTHTPMNDGPYPQAAVILDEDGNVVSSTGAILSASIPRFYIDGKYTVEHWQEDNTNRTGDTSGVTDYAKYDNLSNVESITFYIEGGGLAPWITSIKTIPSVVKEGDQYRLQIGVDDAEKDILRLTTEVYQDKKLIYTHKQANIISDANGAYPYITTGFPPIAEPGKYDVVCTVRDWAGAGIGSYKFTVVSEGKITGLVNHTDQWDDNRKKYNLKRFSEEVNRPMQLDDYVAMSTPRKRGTNVFWSGERFMLQSETEEKPSSVQVQIFSLDENGIRKSTGYSTELFKTGKKTASGAELWEGSLWDSGMINKWGRKAPEQLLFSFTAYYSGGTTKNNEVMIIVDSRQDYWQLHRLW